MTLHLVAVDMAMAGPLVSVWLEWLAVRQGDEESEQSACALARLSLALFNVGVALGAVLLAIRWGRRDTDYFEAIAVLPRSRIWFSLGELLFYLACMLAYLRFWRALSGRRYVHRLLAIAASLNLMVHFPALFAIIAVVDARPEMWGQVVDRAGYWRLLLDGEVVSRVVHVWLSAAVVAGVAVMLLASRRWSAAATPAAAMPAAVATIRRGATLALAAAMLQVPVGLWTMVQLPEPLQGKLLGADWLATGLLAASLLLALQLMYTLVSIVLGDWQRGNIVRSAALVGLLMLAMTGTRSCLHGRFEPPRHAAGNDQGTDSSARANSAPA
jgi:hypothetical protein